MIFTYNLFDMTEQQGTPLKDILIKHLYTPRKVAYTIAGGNERIAKRLYRQILGVTQINESQIRELVRIINQHLDTDIRVEEIQITPKKYMLK